MVRNRLHPTALPICVFFLLPFFFSCGEGKGGETDIQQRVTAELKNMQGYGAVQAVVRDRVVFLTGQCEGAGCAQQLEERMREVEGVIGVENDVTEGASLNR